MEYGSFLVFTGCTTGITRARTAVDMLANLSENISENIDDDIADNITEGLETGREILEVWEQTGEKGSIHVSKWPEVDASAIKDEKIEIPVQINGKVRAKIEVVKGMDEHAVREAVEALENVKKHVGSKDIKKFIYVPERIVTVVVA